MDIDRGIDGAIVKTAGVEADATAGQRRRYDVIMLAGNIRGNDSRILKSRVPVIAARRIGRLYPKRKGEVAGKRVASTLLGAEV